MQIDAHKKTQCALTRPSSFSLHRFACVIGTAVCIVHLLMHIQENCSLAKPKIFSGGSPMGVKRVCCQSLCMRTIMNGWMDDMLEKKSFMSSNKYVLCLRSGCAASRSELMIS